MKHSLFSLFILALTVVFSGCIYVGDGSGFDDWDHHDDDDILRRVQLEDVELLSNGGDPVFIATLDARLDREAEIEFTSVKWESDDGSSSLTFDLASIATIETIDLDSDEHEVRYRGSLGLEIDDRELCGDDGELTVEIRAFSGDDTEDRTVREDVAYQCD